MYGQPELYINEFMADNDNVIADPQGDYDDWIEIYNPVDMDIDLEDFFLTDDLADTVRHRLRTVAGASPHPPLLNAHT